MSGTLKSATLTVHGQTREYWYYNPSNLPTDFDAVIACPFGSTSPDAGKALWTGVWSLRWQDRQISLAFPDPAVDCSGSYYSFDYYGANQNPNEPCATAHVPPGPGIDETRDEDFMVAIRADMAARAVAAGKTLAKVALMGGSSGSAMAAGVAIRNSSAFEAYSLVARGLHEPQSLLVPVAARPLQIHHGDADPNWLGFPGAGGILSGEASRDWWAAKLGCTGYSDTTLTGTSHNATHRVYSGGSAAFEWDRGLGTGHRFFKSTAPQGDAFHSDVQAMDFFKRAAGFRYV